MSTREDPVVRGKEKGAAAHLRFRTEIREARLNLGKSQRVAAAEADIDPAVWSRLERGTREALTLTMAGRMAAAVGLDLVLQFYPADRVLRDGGHARLLRDVKALLGPDWSWRFEVPIAPFPDQRAWDAVATHRATRLRVRVEAETRVRDCQAVMRRIEAKRVTDGKPRVLLAIRGSRDNRDAVAAAQDVFASAFPVAARNALVALRGGVDPVGDVLLLVDWSRSTAPPSVAGARLTTRQ